MTTTRSTRPASSIRAARLTRGSRALAMGTASVAGVAALVAGTHASAAEPVRAPAVQRVAAVTTIDALPLRPVRVEHQVGTVLEGTADAGTPVMVFLYENSLHGSSLQVVLGDPEDDDIGSIEQAGAFIHDGALDVTVEVNGTPVHLQGTVAPSGRPTRIVEPVQDNGEQIVSKGTNTPLVTDVTVTVDGASAPVAFAPAFAFDLESRTVTLHPLRHGAGRD
jgi:hypothetical protein